MSYQKEIGIADNCRSCGMCRIDYLGTGTCDAAEEHVYAAHHPYGRLRIFREMVTGKLPLTTELRKIIDSCTLCGKCDLQCYFQIERTPADVFAAQKKLFLDLLQDGDIIRTETDQVLAELRAAVGEQWASNDPAILASYAVFGSLSNDEKVPAYVVLPENAEQTAAVVRIANQHHIDFLPISSGTNSSNLIKGECILIDMNRMKTLKIHESERWAEVGAGVIAFDLQQAAMRKGLRFSIGEAAACVCANQVSTGIHSFFAYKNGMMADHYLEAELVTLTGEVIRTTSNDAPQIPTTPKDEYRPHLPYVLTRLKIRLHPVATDETVIFLPFTEMSEALETARELAQSGIGTGLGLLGIEVLSSFLAITEEDTENFLDIARDYLKINYAILMLLTEDDLNRLRERFPDLTVVEEDSMQGIIQGIPAITGPESMALIEDVMDEERPYEHLFGDMLEYFLNNIRLKPEEITELFAHLNNRPLQNLLEKRYFQPEFSDPEYWFNYRMFSPRFMRNHWFFSVMHFTDADDLQLIEDICDRYREFGEIHDIKNEFCYIMPIDGGKRFFFEYEYFCNQRDEDMLQRLRKVFFLLAHDTRRMVTKGKGVYPVLNTLFNGLNKKDAYLYSNLDAG